jgi:hypothetical protein
MRTRKIILALGAIVLFCIMAGGFFYLSSPHLRFRHKSAGYYSEVAHACDSVLQQHPVGSNDSVVFNSGMTLPYTKALSVSDGTLPKIISALHPDMILISTNRVWIEIPPERMGGFVITWEPDDMRTNHWALQSGGDGLVTTVYEATKP